MRTGPSSTAARPVRRQPGIGEGSPALRTPAAALTARRPSAGTPTGPAAARRGTLRLRARRAPLERPAPRGLLGPLDRLARRPLLPLAGFLVVRAAFDVFGQPFLLTHLLEPPHHLVGRLARACFNSDCHGVSKGGLSRAFWEI